MADGRVQRGVVTHKVKGLRIVQPGEEQRAQPVAVEVGFARCRLVVMPQGVEVVGAAVKAQPALAADEMNEQQPIEQGLRELLGVRPFNALGQLVHRIVIGFLVYFEELVGDGLDIEAGSEAVLGGSPLTIALPTRSRQSNVVRFRESQ